MYSSEDFEIFYFQCQTEANPHGVSLQSFCLQNNVPYNVFYKWYKDTRSRIVAVQVDGVPSVPTSESVPSSPLGEKSIKRKSACCSSLYDETKNSLHFGSDEGRRLLPYTIA